MNLENISYRDMFGLFIAINILVLSMVFYSTNPKLEDQIKGMATVQDLTSVISFESTTDNIKFEYPSLLGKANSAIITNQCLKAGKTEFITFDNFPNFIIGLNECDIGINLFTPDREIVISNKTGNLTMVGSIDSNYNFEGYTNLRLVSEDKENNSATITLKVLFNEKEITRQEILNITNMIVRSIQLN